MAELCTYKMKIAVLTPTHIGSGEQLGPYEYYFDKNYKVHKIPENFFERVKELGILDAYLNYCKTDRGEGKNSLTEFCRNNQKVIGIVANSSGIKATSELKKPNYSIRLIIRSGGKPLIPGSSIKGVIRTAWLLKNAKADGNYGQVEKYDSDEEVKRFFQGIVVGDFMPDANAPMPIVEIDNFKAIMKRGGILDFCEYIAPLESSLFYGTIRTRTKEDFESIMKALKEYGEKCLQLDIERYGKDKIPHRLLKESQEAIVFKMGFGKGYFANSVGFKWRGTQEFRNLTLKEKLKFRGKNGEPSSMRIVNNMPPGWVSLRKI